jgi:hypothetical protein
MGGPVLNSSAELALAEALADFTLRVATPIVWHDRKEGWPKRIYGGTCFFLQFATGTIAVTANHVLEALQKAIADNSNTVCQIRTSKPIDLLGLVVDRCFERDIATIRISEDLLKEIGATVLDCTGDWPPPQPVEGRTVTFCGFPEGERTTPEPGVLAAFACGSVTIIDAVTERDIIVTYDPARDVKAAWAPWVQPLGYNMSGCSGGPVLSHGLLNGLQRWFPIAMIIKGPKDQGTGEVEGWDMLIMRRIDIIQPDGTIKHEHSGWLPR